MFRGARRLTAAASAVVVAGAMSFLLAGPARADKSDCVQYLREAGYPNSVELGQACGFAVEGGDPGIVQCARLLLRVEVTRGEAVSACRLAPV